MFSKISARLFLKVLNAPTIGHHNAKTLRLMSSNSPFNIDVPLMVNADHLHRKERNKSSFVFNSAEAINLNIPTERKEFMALFPNVLKDVSELVEKLFKNEDLVDRIIKAIKYNVPNGRHIFSMSLIVTYKTLSDPAQLTPENMKMIRLLGWIFEMIVGTLLVADDIIDRGETRRNQPCWYLLEDVKLSAVNDVLLMENLAYYLLKKYFSNLPCYPKLFEEFHKMFLITLTGQHVDDFIIRKGVEHFTKDNFKRLCDLKTSYGVFCLPFALVTKFIGIDNPELYHQTTPIFNGMGMYKQAQNDFYGCFGDSSESRKISPEIEDGQCNWLAVKCMELATPAQREIMIECYGKRDTEKVKLVKQLYEDLNIPDLFYQYEDETYNKLLGSIRKLSCGIRNEALVNILNLLFNRT